METKQKTFLFIKINLITLALIFITSGCENKLTKSPRPAPPDVAVTDISAPSSCVQGDTLPITVSIENKSNSSESFVITLNNVTDGLEITNQMITLSAAGADGIDNVVDRTFDAEEDAENFFGQMVCVGGDVNGDGYNELLIGADGYNQGQGRAYLYFGGKGMLNERADRIFPGEGKGDHFGDCGGAFGDVNGDGYADVIIGARGYSGESNDGRIYIYHGGPNMDETADIILDGPVGEGGYYGLMVASGDVNNDGYDDLLTTACALESQKGRAYLYYGGNPMDTRIAQTFEGENANDLFGRYTAIGDIDGDSCADILIGARNYKQGDRTGRVYLYYGDTATPMDATCDLMFTGETTMNYLSTGLDIFDIDNDSFDDVLIGACRYNPSYNPPYIGRAYLFWGGSRAVFDNVADKIFDGEPGSGNAYFGGDSGVGYVNDDEYGDILISAYLYPNNRMSGRAYLYYGNTKTSMDVICDQTFTGTDQNSRYGVEAELGDLNNDDFAEVVIGGWSYNNNRGRVWLYYGEPSDLADVKFNWDTAEASIGKHTLKVEIPPVPGEEDTADNSKTITVDIKAPS